MEELLQVVLKRSASEQQLVLQRVVVQHSEELITGREKGEAPYKNMTAQNS